MELFDIAQYQRFENIIQNIIKFNLLNTQIIENIKKDFILYTEESKTNKNNVGDYKQIINTIINNFDDFKNKLFSLDTKIIVKIINNSYFIADPRLYGYTIPDNKIIKKIKKISKNKCILELGAGCGLWAALLQKINVNIIPTDIQKQNIQYTKILIFDNISALKKYNCEFLMLSWPNFDDDMAYISLQNFKNKYFIYLGESQYGACANDKFFNLLKKKWILIYSKYITPFWYDYIIFNKKKLKDLNIEHKIYIYKRIV